MATIDWTKYPALLTSRRFQITAIAIMAVQGAEPSWVSAIAISIIVGSLLISQAIRPTLGKGHDPPTTDEEKPDAV